MALEVASAVFSGISLAVRIAKWLEEGRSKKKVPGLDAIIGLEDVPASLVLSPDEKEMRKSFASKEIAGDSNKLLVIGIRVIALLTDGEQQTAASITWEDSSIEDPSAVYSELEEMFRSFSEEYSEDVKYYLLDIGAASNFLSPGFIAGRLIHVASELLQIYHRVRSRHIESIEFVRKDDERPAANIDQNTIIIRTNEPTESWDRVMKSVTGEHKPCYNLVLIGGSGNGKSTLGNVITGGTGSDGVFTPVKGTTGTMFPCSALFQNQYKRVRVVDCPGLGDQAGLDFLFGVAISDRLSRIGKLNSLVLVVGENDTRDGANLAQLDQLILFETLYGFDVINILTVVILFTGDLNHVKRKMKAKAWKLAMEKRAKNHGVQNVEVPVYVHHISEARKGSSKINEDMNEIINSMSLNRFSEHLFEHRKLHADMKAAHAKTELEFDNAKIRSMAEYAGGVDTFTSFLQNGPFERNVAVNRKAHRITFTGDTRKAIGLIKTVWRMKETCTYKAVLDYSMVKDSMLLGDIENDSPENVAKKVTQALNEGELSIDAKEENTVPMTRLHNSVVRKFYVICAWSRDEAEARIASRNIENLLSLRKDQLEQSFREIFAALKGT